MQLREEIWKLLMERRRDRVYADTYESVGHAHAALEGLRNAVLRLAWEVERLQSTQDDGHEERSEPTAVGEDV